MTVQDFIMLFMFVGIIYLCIRQYDNSKSIHSLHLKNNQMSTTLKDIQEQLADLDQVIDITINEKNAKLADLEKELSEAKKGTVDQEKLDSIASQILAMKTKITSSAATA